MDDMGVVSGLNTPRFTPYAVIDPTYSFVGAVNFPFSPSIVRSLGSRDAGVEAEFERNEGRAPCFGRPAVVFCFCWSHKKGEMSQNDGIDTALIKWTKMILT